MRAVICRNLVIVGLAEDVNSSLSAPLLLIITALDPPIIVHAVYKDYSGAHDNITRMGDECNDYPKREMRSSSSLNKLVCAGSNYESGSYKIDFIKR